MQPASEQDPAPPLTCRSGGGASERPAHRLRGRRCADARAELGRAGGGTVELGLTGAQTAGRSDVYLNPPGVVVSVLTFLFWGDKVVFFEFNVFGVSGKWGDQSIPRSARALDLGSENLVRILPTAGPRAILFVCFCSRGFLKFPFVLPGRQ